MLVALLCHVDASREEDRLRLRADHLQYIADHRERIFAGGPTLSASGAPETMILLIEAESLPDAEAFIHSEPYTSHGVFHSVDIRAWARVMPEPHPGALDEALAAERARHAAMRSTLSGGNTP